MNVLDIATKTIQNTIIAAINGVRGVVDGTKVKVDAIDTRTTTMNTNVNTINTRTATMDANINTFLAGRVVKSVQRGMVNGTDSAADRTIVISAVVTNKCSVTINGVLQNSSSLPIILKTFNSNSLIIGLSASNASVWSSTVTTTWEVVEFY